MSIDGFVVSSIVNVAVVVLALPQSSVAVKITYCSSTAVAQGNEVVAPSPPPQASEAVAPPLLASQSFNSVMLPMPSHSTVESEAIMSIDGFVMSQS